MIFAEQFEKLNTELTQRGYRTGICATSETLYSTIEPYADAKLPAGTSWFKPNGAFSAYRKSNIFLNPDDGQVYVATPGHLLASHAGGCAGVSVWDKMSVDQFLEKTDILCGRPTGKQNRLQRFLHQLNIL